MAPRGRTSHMARHNPRGCRGIPLPGLAQRGVRAEHADVRAFRGRSKVQEVYAGVVCPQRARLLIHHLLDLRSQPLGSVTKIYLLQVNTPCECTRQWDALLAYELDACDFSFQAMTLYFAYSLPMKDPLKISKNLDNLILRPYNTIFIANL